MKLTSLAVGSIRTIGGKKVIRISEDKFDIDGQEVSISSANRILKIKADYSSFIFIMVEPPHRVITTHILETEEEYIKLVDTAKKKKLCLYFSEYKEINGKKYAQQPWLLDYNAITEPKPISRSKSKEVEIVDESNNLICPYCKKQMSSSSGLTNHINSKHAKNK